MPKACRIFFILILASTALAQTPNGASTVSGPRLAKEDPLTRSGIEHLYSLEYPQAQADFTKALEQHPDDPFAINHLLQTVLLHELYRLNALDTTLYADNGFLTGKPLAGDPAVKKRIEELEQQTLTICDARIKANPNDAECYYARGVARGAKLSYVAVVEKSFGASLKNALASRKDHEKCLEIDPSYTDAKLVVGMHNFIVGSLSMPLRIMIGIVGISGNKEKGIEYLTEVSNANDEASVDARVALALFLRREGKYNQAYDVIKANSDRYPRNFLFALEAANALKDAGRGNDAIAAYTRILEQSRDGKLTDPHIERAQYGLAESLNGQHKAQAALAQYEAALASPKIEPEVKIRALLGAGEMLDILGDRDKAVEHYRTVVELDTDSKQAERAKKFLSHPYIYPTE